MRMGLGFCIDVLDREYKNHSFLKLEVVGIASFVVVVVSIVVSGSESFISRFVLHLHHPRLCFRVWAGLVPGRRV
jgi:hypothetical protein